MNFSGQNAIITGAGSERGFGRTIAHFLADRGCNIVVSDLDEAGARETARQVAAKGRKAAGMFCDVTEPASVKASMEEAVRVMGQIHILINNAGYTQKIASQDIGLEDWNRMITVHMTGAFLCAQAIIPHMTAKEYGRIVSISSLGMRNGGVTGGAHYCAAKAGIAGFSRTLAKDTARHGITVNCVAPGPCLTDIGGLKYEDKSVPSDILMGRRGKREEVAAAVAFLASPLASYITGVNLDVNGGAYFPM
ncbi:MAG: SDR family oxidoreductase [Deltaproteobacteria bacterium]|nr:SDR family oxidoreductase [Deltaproteobacteria bacterium]